MKRNRWFITLVLALVLLFTLVLPSGLVFAYDGSNLDETNSSNDTSEENLKEDGTTKIQETTDQENSISSTDKQNVISLTSSSDQKGNIKNWILKGDLNRDGKITNEDRSILEQYMVGDPLMPEFDRESADMNSNNRITVQDLEILEQIIDKGTSTIGIPLFFRVTDKAKENNSISAITVNNNFLLIPNVGESMETIVNDIPYTVSVDLEGVTTVIGEIPMTVNVQFYHGFRVKYESGFDDIVIADKENVKWNDLDLLPEKPKKPGYQFIGWTVHDELISGNTQYADLAINQKDISSISLIAQWKERTDYNIYYDTNGGTMPAGMLPILSEIKYTDNIPYPIPIRSGYTFKGWQFNKVLVKNGTSYNLLAQDDTIKRIELSALWEINEYNVTYEFISENVPNVPVPDEVTIEYGETIKVPELISPVNWFFDGWYIDRACTIKFNFITPVSSDITLYGKWNYQGKTGPLNPSKSDNENNSSKTTVNREDASASQSTAVKTGDKTNMLAYITYMSISIVGMAMLLKIIKGASQRDGGITNEKEK